MAHLWAPRPDSRAALLVYLHECAHFALHGDDVYRPHYLSEYQAESWAIARMRKAGIAVPYQSLFWGRSRIAFLIARALLCWEAGLPVDPDAARFAWGRNATRWLKSFLRAREDARHDRIGTSYPYFSCRKDGKVVTHTLQFVSRRRGEPVP
jgi:hypothetical protein